MNQEKQMIPYCTNESRKIDDNIADKITVSGELGMYLINYFDLYMNF